VSSVKTECIAAYAQDLRFVQVSAVVLDEADRSLHQHLKTASIKLLYGGNAFLTKQITVEDYNAGEQSFYCFFLNPPVDQDLAVTWEVETFEGLTSRIKVPVRMGMQLPYSGAETNPMGGTRLPLDFSDSTNQLNGVKTPL
jgi:hypothetical protein